MDHGRREGAQKEETMSKQPTPNDQRSDVKNPNNPQHQQNQDNRAGQLNPQHPAHPENNKDGESDKGGRK